MRRALRTALWVITLAMAPAALAEDFDGSRPLVCAPVEVLDCIPDAEAACLPGTPRQMGAPTFLRIDFAAKTVTGPRGEVPIAAVHKQEAQLLLQGVETVHAFAIALDRKDGSMTATLSDRTGAFVLFGSCTPL